jgi:hypothetical protein
MQRYYDWLKTLTSTDRAILLSEASPTERVKAINSLKQREVQQGFALLGSDPGQIILKDQDNAAVLRWMKDFADIHESDLSPVGPDSKRPDSQKTDERRRRRPVSLAWQEWWGPAATGTPPVTEADIHSLRELLSPKKQKELDAEANLKDQVQLIRQWIQHASIDLREFAIQSFGRWGNPPNFERLKRFEDQQMTGEEKQELVGLSGAERMRKVMELYQKHRATDSQRPGGSGVRQPNDVPSASAGKSDNHENIPPSNSD